MFDLKFYELMNPAMQAFHELGGSASIKELEEAVIRNLELSEEDASDIHRGNISKVRYRLAWARTYLKNYGLVENSSRGVWSLTVEGRKVKSVDGKEVQKKVKELQKKNVEPQISVDDELDETSNIVTWQEQLLEVIKGIEPASFENLCKRLLRESGFINVQVTGGAGDGGIDGRGILKLGGLLSFHVAFQAKRYKDTVGSSVVRDFRGAMIGRADKGLIITTGRFTGDAKAEAQRDGAVPIDLIDGEDLVEMLKTLAIGVSTKIETVENVEIDKNWFENI